MVKSQAHLIRLPKSILADIIKDLRRSDLAGLMRVHSVLSEVCKAPLYTFVRLGDDDCSNPPIQGSSYLQHVRCLHFQVHEPSRCFEICHPPPSTQPCSVEVVRYDFATESRGSFWTTHRSQYLAERHCEAAKQLRPSVVVLINVPTPARLFKHIVPSADWASAQNLVLWMKPHSFPQIFEVTKKGSILPDDFFTHALSMRLPALSWMLDYTNDRNRYSSKDVVHYLLYTGWGTHVLAWPTYYDGQRLLFSCVVPDWVLPPFCLRIIRRIITAFRSYIVKQFFEVPDDKVATMEIITMSEFMSRPGHGHILNQDEVRAWTESPDVEYDVPSVEDVLGWVQLEDWMPYDEFRHAGRPLLDQHLWFPSMASLRGNAFCST